jgi:NADPH:quinone reductase-like Zn-dependent oxidoreductase
VSSFGAPDKVIGLVERPDPGEPGPGEVLIAAEFVPINPADVLNLEGRYGAEPPSLPMNPGAEGVGRVAATGAGVTHVKPGDRVLLPGPGTWRERFKAPAKVVFPLPA